MTPLKAAAVMIAFMGVRGADAITGGAGADTLYGGIGDDVIFGGFGDDTIYGGAGQDAIVSGDGSGDRIYGGHGDDFLVAGDTGSVVYGGDGIDFMRGGGGVDGGFGATYYLDTREKSANTDIIAQFAYDADSDAKNNRLRLHVDETQLRKLDAIANENAWLAALQDMFNIRWDNAGDAKADTALATLLDNSKIKSAPGYDFDGADTDTDTTDNVAFYHTRGTADASDDYLIMVIGGVEIGGTADADLTRDIFELYSAGIEGSSDSDTLTGTIYDDTMRGHSGSDTMQGHEGSDYLRGGDGGDKIYGGAGHDTIDGDAGDDILYGGAGADVIEDYDGINAVYGGAGRDIVTGTSDNVVFGGQGNDVVTGGRRAKTYGGDGIDVLVGNDETRYYLDTRELSSNTDIVTNFSFQKDIYEARLLIYVDAADKALIDAESGNPAKLTKLLDLANLRFDNGDTPSDIDYLAQTRASATRALFDDDPDEENTLIYHTRGTADDTSDDILLMVIEDFVFDALITDETAYEAFDVRITPTNFDPNGGAEALPGLIGGAGDDVLAGLDDDDVLRGGAGADDISGGAGDDALYGGAGGDTIEGGAGGDMLYGEAGKDVLIGGAGGDVFVLSSDQFTDADSALIVEDFSDAQGDKILIDLRDWGIGAVTGFAGANLRIAIGHINAITSRTEDDATTQNTAIYYTQGTDDILVLVLEDFTGLNFADDVLVAYDGNFGTIGADSISGTARADKLYGFAGDDWLAGGAGADTLDGGVGSDTLYGGAGADVLYGGAGVDRLFGEAGADTIYGGADIDAIKGGAGADTLYGEGGEDTLYGGAGDDVLYGGDADDTLYGESGADTIYGGAGVDRLYGGAGADRLYGGAGRDRIYGGADDDWLYGDDNRDILYGDAGADRIYGGADADILYGNAGADRIYGDAGADRLYGNAGADRIYGEAGADRLYGNDGADVLYGGVGEDALYGGAGNDVLYGDDGDDALYGGAGDDVLYGGKGVNYLTGGAGADVFVLPQELFGRTDTKFIITDYNTREGDLILFALDGEAPSIFDFNHGHVVLRGRVFTDSSETTKTHPFNSPTDDPNADNFMVNFNSILSIVIEDNVFAMTNSWLDEINYIAGQSLISGTQGADTITGNADDNALIGLAGDDTIHGGGGADIIWGHLGADTLYGGAGDDTIYGDADLNTRDGPHYYSGADTIYGGDGNDFIYTGLGEDTAYGGRGDDAIFGGASEVSVLSGGVGIDFLSSRANNFATFVLDLEVRDGEHYDAVADFKFDNNDRFKSNQIRIYATAEQLRILDAIDDEALWLETLQELLNIRWDEAGDIKFTSTLKEIVKDFGDFQDLPDGFTFRGADTDTDNNDDVVFYRKLGTIDREDDVAVLFLGNLEINGVSGAKVTRAIFDLQLHPHTPTLSGTDGADTLEGAAGTDSIHGGVGADTILGHGGNDYLFGNEGDDTIYGGAGNDYIDGGTDADTIYGGDGNDEIDGGTESDSIYSGDGNDYIEGGEGNDRIYGGDGIDTLRGDDGADTLYGEAGADVLYGGEDADTLFGDAGADTLSGGDDADILHGGGGADTLRGDDGFDLLYGGAGADMLEGGADDDMLFGGVGDDVLDGGADDDMLFGGGGGVDILIGGLQRDIFVISSDAFTDSDSVLIVEDFSGWNGNADQILIDLKNWGSKNYGTWDDLGLRVATGHITAPGITRTEDDASTQNTAIYYTHGTSATTDDTLIMLLEDATLVFSDDHLENDIVIAFDGNYGTTGDDIIVGDARDNYLIGREGSDILYGGAGNDYLVTFSNAHQDWVYGGAGDDHIRTGAKDTIFGGTGNDILRFSSTGTAYGGDGIDYIDGRTSVYYHLDTRQIADNTDVLEDFAHDPGVHDHYLLVYVSAADKALIDASTGDAAKLAKLMELENLRFEDGTTPDAIDTILTAHFAAEGLDRRDDAGTTNRLIYHTRGTSSENDDLLLMVLEDFTDTMLYAMFDVRITPPDFDVNGEDPPAEGVRAYDEDTLAPYLPSPNLPALPESTPTPDHDAAPISTNPTESGERLHVSDDTNSVYGLGGNDRLYGGDGADALYGGAGNDMLIGGAGDDYFVGGFGIDVLVSQGTDNDIFYLDIREITGNTDIVTHFHHTAHRLSGQNKLRVEVSAADLAAINALTTDAERLEALQNRANLRWEKSSGNGLDDTNSGSDDARKQNLHIWHTRLGRSDESDDLLLMVIEDFAYDDLTYAMFDVVAKETNTRVFDVDDGTTPATTPTWILASTGSTLAIESVNGADYDAADSVFEIFSNTIFRLKANTNLDHTTTPHYEVRVKITANNGAISYEDVWVQVNAPTTNADIVGTDGDDIIYGDAFDNLIHGKGGDDYLDGGYSRDVIFGGSGANTLAGGDATDLLFGGFHDDAIYGGAGADYLYGGAGTDMLYGGGGADTIEGGVGNDITFGGGGDDNLVDLYGTNRIYGGAGNDYIDSRDYNILFGGTGNDVIRAQGDGSWLYGGTGIDVLIGNIFNISTRYYLDTRELSSNTDILPEYDFNSIISIIAHKFLIHTNAENKALIDAETTDAEKLAKLMELENLRFDKGATPDYIDYHTATRFGDIEGFNYADDANTDNTLIYHTRGTSDTYDDILLMVIEDFTQDIIYTMFDVRVADADFDVNGNNEADALQGDIRGVGDYELGFQQFAAIDASAPIIFVDKRTDTTGAKVGTFEIPSGATATLQTGAHPFTLQNGNELWTTDGTELNRETQSTYALELTFTQGGATTSQTAYVEVRTENREVVGSINTVVFGTENADSNLQGSDEDDSIYGGAGADTLRGGAGADTLYGGAGADTLRGDAGADLFYLNIDDGARDIVRDYEAADKILLVVSDALIDMVDADNYKDLAGIRVSLGADTIIYDTRGTTSESDDIAIMELQRYRTALTYDSFEIISETAHKSRVLSDFGIPGNRVIPDGFRVNPLTEITSVAVDEHEFTDTATAQHLTDLDIDTLGADIFVEIESVDGTKSGIPQFTIRGNELWLADGTYLSHQDKPTYEVIVRETDLAAETITYHLVRVAVTAVETDLTPTDGADRFYGDAGGERIFGGAGDDILYGGVGADYIDGGYDHDVIHGGAGDDLLFGQGGHDTIYGGAGDDVLAGGGRNNPNRVNISVDYLLGGDGNDLIYANVSDAGQGQFGSIAHGGAGDDRVEAISGVAYGGTGIDMLSGSRDDGHFYLDTRAMPDNTDIIEHFQFHANEDSGIKNKLVVTITEAQHAALDKIENDAEAGWETVWLNQLQEFLGIRWDVPGRAGAATDVTKIIANSDIAYQDSFALGIVSGDAFATPETDDVSDNFAIWKIVGADDSLDTNSESDDILILVADKAKLADGVHPDMFDVHSDETEIIRASGDFTRHVINVFEHLGGGNVGQRLLHDVGANAGASVEIVAIDGTNGNGTGTIFEIRNEDLWLREGARFLADAERHEIALKITESGAVSYQIIDIFISDVLRNYGTWYGVGDALRSTADSSSNPRASLTPDVGTSLAEYYHGGGGNDIINTRGGNDWIWGGIGNDIINLRGAPIDESVETIIYRFTSASTGFEATDGVDTITNFRRGEDVLIFSDLDTTPIASLTNFLSTAHRGESGGKLNVRPIIVDGMLEGVEILFALRTILKITYDLESRVDVGVNGAYTSAAATYLGALSGGIPDGYDASTGLLTDNALLTNYFGAGKLQVIDDIPYHARGHIPAEYAIAGSPYTIIGESLHAVEITPDPDGIPDGINTVSYQWFTIDADGTETDISGATAATYTFQAGDSITADYGVKISYTDKAGRAHNIEAIQAPFYFVAGSRNQVINLRETDAITALERIIAGVRAVTDTEDTIKAYHVEGAPWVEISHITGAVSIAEGTKIDYEENSQIIVSITAISSTEEYETTTKLTINVENVEEGSAVFDIGGYIASGQTLTAALRTDDPDGVDADGYSYQWFTTTDGGTTKTDISGADEASYKIKSGDDLTKTYGVSITYTDGYGTDYEGTDAITLLASKSTAQFAFGRGDQSVSVGEGSDGLVEVTASDTLNGRGAVTVSPDGKSWTFVLDEPLPDNNLHNESFSLTIMHPDGTTETRDVDLRIQNLGGYVYTLGFGNPQNSIAAYNTPITQPIASVTPRLASVAATGDGTISYSITSGNDDNAFAIDASTGTITLIKALDYETATTRTLEITATDGGNTDASTNKNTATITINVENINDNMPVFVFDGNGVYNKVTIPETIAPGEVVKWIQATDADGDRLTYRLTTHAEHYEIDEDTGLITVKEGHGLDYDSGLIANHRITFSVSDGTTTITETVPVSLTNINDELPMFIGAVSGSDTAILRVGTAPTGGTSTGYKIHVDDLDLGRRFDNYELQFQNSEDRFEFRPDGYFGNYRVFELYLKAGESVAAGDINLEYRIFDGDNYAEETQSITVYAITRTTFTSDMGDQTVEVAENDADAEVATVKAIGFGTVTYSITSGNSGGAFTIDSASGKITLTEALDYETATSYSLVITATDDGNSDTNTKTNTATITINVQDTNDNDPIFAPLQVDTTSGAIAGLGVAELAGLTGTSAAEYINGGAGADTITSGGGADHIVGGAGTDTVNLETTSGSVETVYYRFTSSDSVAWEGVDDWVTIEGFHRGEDRIVFLDTDGSVIDLTTFLSAGNRGTNGGQLVISPRFNNDNIVGADIKFGSNALRIGYTLDSQEEVRSGNTYNALAEKYLGAGTSNPASWDGTDLTNNNLLRNYLNVKSGDDNLQIVDDAYLARIAADVLIPESLTGGDGKFATVSATDADATTTNNQVRYHITGGTGMGVFVIDEFNGEISVSDGQTLDYDTTTSYTLEIGATDNRNADGNPDDTIDDTQEITIAITDINDLAPRIATISTSVFLNDGAPAGMDTGIRMTITDDIMSENFEITYKNFNTMEDITGFELRHISGTTYGLYLTAVFDFDAFDSTTISNGIVAIRIGVSDILDGTTTRTAESLDTVSFTAFDINDNKPVLQDPVWQTDTYETEGVPEGIPTGSEIFQMIATDADKNPSFTYRIVSVDGVNYDADGNPEDGSAALFGIQSVSGRFGVLRSLDYDTAQSHSVVFQASDGVNLSDTKAVVISVKDQPEASPAITPDRQAIPQNPIDPDDDPLAGLTPIPDTDPYS